MRRVNNKEDQCHARVLHDVPPERNQQQSTTTRIPPASLSGFDDRSSDIADFGRTLVTTRILVERGDRHHVGVTLDGQLAMVASV